MTRTLFVGEPTARDLDDLRARRPSPGGSDRGASRRPWSVGQGRPPRTLPSGREIDAVARERHRAPPVTATGFGHGTGHGIGLATHEAPSLGRLAPDEPLPSPTVFSVEPGVYLDGEMGVRIEDLVVLDAAAGRVERLTRFPRDVLVVGG